MNISTHVSIETAAIRRAAERMERLLARCVVGAAGCSALIGAMVLIGWYARIPVLTRVAPSFVAMQYNTAVAFLLAAGALAALRRGRAGIAVACAGGVLAIGGLTLVEHVVGASFGIDQLLWHLGVSRDAMGELANVRQSAPGRMAPNTSLSFALLGGALLVLASGTPRRRGVIASAALALGASALGTVAFSGYLIGIPTAYGWGNLTRMALPTSFAVSLLGLGTAAAAMLAGVRAERSTRDWLPGLTALAVAVSTLMMWQAMVDHDRRDVADTIAQRARLLSNGLTRGIEERGQLLMRIGAREGHGGSAQRANLTERMSRTLRDYPGLLDVAILDAAGTVQWGSPPASDVVAGGAMQRSAGRSAAIAEARSSRRAAASGAVSIDSLRRGLYLVAPVLKGDSVTGFVASNLWLAPLAEDVLRDDLTAGDAYLVRDGDVVLHTHRPVVELAPEAWTTAVDADALGATLTLVVSPSAAAVHRASSSVPLAFLLCGLAAALIAGIGVRLAQRARDDALRFAVVADELARENEVRRAAEAERDAQAEELLMQSEELEAQNESLQETAAELEEQRDALERAQELSAALVRSTPAAVAGFDTAGCVIAWNPAMGALTGRAPTDALGRSVGVLLTFLRPEEESELLAEALQGRPAQLTDVRARVAATGGECWLDVSVTPMRTTEGRVLGGLIVGSDMTERKRVADLIIASRNSAEQANRAKSEFLARMSHELRTPLNSVIGFTNVLRRKGAQMTPEHRNYVERINANGRHLLGLINDVLDLSKIEAGRETVRLEPSAITGIVETTVAELWGRANDAQVELAVVAPGDLAEAVTDAGRLKQVLINLIGNAIKFTPRAGRVTVRVVADAPDKLPSRIEVEDTGIGIADDRLVAIFQAFEQGEEDTARVYGGTGLGLAISQKLCRLMGHELTVESELGSGSRFTVVLRAGEGRQAA